MKKAKSFKQIYEKLHAVFDFKGLWRDVFGTPEVNGAWLIWGAEKNGKTWFALMLAKYLATFMPAISAAAYVLYISAEEGTGKGFTDASQRAGIDAEIKTLKAMDYITIEELREMLGKRRAPKIVFLDNVTIYNEELKYGAFRKLLNDFPDTLFVFLAHEENKQPFTSTAKMCRRLAKIIVHVEGLQAQVSGRCPGGIVNIHETKAELYHGVAA